MKTRMFLCNVIVLILVLSCGSTPPKVALDEAKDYDYVLDPSLSRARLDAIAQSIEVKSVIDEGTVRNGKGQVFKRVDIGLDMVLDGYIAKEGWLEGRLLDMPTIFQQQGEMYELTTDFLTYSLPMEPGKGEDKSELFYAKGMPKAEAGSGMTILYPENKNDWNGKLYIVLQNAGVYGKLGELVQWDSNDLFTRGTGKNYFIPLMIDKGYAVAWLRRDAARAPKTMSPTKAELSDGSIIPVSFDHYATQVPAMSEFAQGFVEETLGQQPVRTYFYGLSAGAMAGRWINYAPYINVGKDGKPIIDGIIVDGAGAGLPLPVLFVDGEDVLLKDKAQKDTFVHQIEFVDQLYYPTSHLQAKHENTRLLMEKGLGDKYRHYELRGVSHWDAGLADTVGKPENLELGGFMDAMIDLLDNWVDKGVVPTPSKMDSVKPSGVQLVSLGAAPGFEPAIDFPERAYPLGVPFVRDRDVYCAFAPFDGKSLEPLDILGRLSTGDTEGIALAGPRDALPTDFVASFVDMNGNGIRDTAETVTQAWRRLGLLGATERLTWDLYASRQAEAAKILLDQKLISARYHEWYLREAAHLFDESGAVWE